MDDCLILGAGVVGLSLAYELAGHGLRVRVLERGRAGRAASWAGAGILPPADRRMAVLPLDRLRGLSHELYPQWSQSLRDQTGIDNGYRRCGGIYLAFNAGEQAALRALADSLHSQQIQFLRLKTDALLEAEPALEACVRRHPAAAAYLAPDEAQVRNPWHLQALLAACRQRGVVIVEGVSATGFDLGDDRVCGVHTETGRLTAGMYAVTAGAWAGELLGRLGVAAEIVPVRGQMLLFRCVRQPFTKVINRGPRYLVARDDGRVLAGSSEERVGFDASTTVQVVEELRQMAVDLVAELRHAELERSWAGLRPNSFDGLPYLGAIPGLKNAFAAAGHFRSGLHLSPATAVLLRQQMLGQVPEIDLHPFRLGRETTGR